MVMVRWVGRALRTQIILGVALCCVEMGGGRRGPNSSDPTPWEPSDPFTPSARCAHHDVNDVDDDGVLL